MIDAGKIVIGGCCPGPADWQCTHCGQEFARRRGNPEILKGTTPAGGVRSELYRLEDGRVIIRELDKNGNLIKETFGHE